MSCVGQIPGRPKQVLMSCSSCLQRPAGPAPSEADPAAARLGQHVRGQHRGEGGVWSCVPSGCPALWRGHGRHRGEKEGGPGTRAPEDHCGRGWHPVQTAPSVSARRGRGWERAEVRVDPV